MHNAGCPDGVGLRDCHKMMNIEPPLNKEKPMNNTGRKAPRRVSPLRSRIKDVENGDNVHNVSDGDNVRTQTFPTPYC